MDADERRLLRIYLADHLALARGGRDLARRMAAGGGHRGADDLLRRAADELDEGRRALTSFLRQLGASRPRVREAAVGLAERMGRLKPNGRVRSRSPLSDLYELEGLATVLGAAALGWRALERAGVAAPEVVGARAEACEALAAEVGRRALEAAERALPGALR